MEHIFQILLKSTICITVCYFFYFLLLRNETWHTLNRIYLILGILFSHLIPFMKITVYQEAPEITSSMVPVALPVDMPFYPTSEAIKTGMTLQPLQILGILYITGIFVMVLRFVVSTCQVLKIIYRSEKVSVNGIKIALYPNALIPFSFFQYLVIGKNDYERDHKRFVLVHEQKHIRQYHWFDMLIMEMITIIHWYNPFVWLVKRSLKTVHEFLADEGVLKHGYGTIEYQKVLLKNTVGEIRYAMAKSFYQSKLKKRLTMMKKNRSTSISRLKLVVFLPLLAILFYSFAERQVIWTQKKTVLSILDSQVQDTVRNWTENELMKSNEFYWSEEIYMGQLMFNRMYETMGERNNLLILMNANADILVDAEKGDLATLSNILELHIKNLDNLPDFSEKIYKTLPYLGNIKTPKYLIFIQKDVKAPQEKYQQLLNILGKTIMKLRNELALEKFQTDYHSLSQAKQDAVDRVYPLNVVFREPTNTPQNELRIDFNSPQEQVMYVSNPPTIYPIKDEYLKKVRSGWGYRIHPKYKIRQFHYGVDFETKKGAPVQATASGVIEKVENQQLGYGKQILVRHDKEFQTRYAHLSEITVTVGEKVSNGQIIGYAGKTGTLDEMFRDSTIEAFLHYEIIKNNKKVNPMDYIPVVFGKSKNSSHIVLTFNSSQAQIGKKRSPILDSLANHRIEVNGELIRIDELEKLIEIQEMGTNVVYPKTKADISWCTGNIGGKKEHFTMLCLPPIDPKDPTQFYVLNGKWIYGRFIRTDEIKSLEILRKDEAVRRYGSKAKYGAIVVVTKDPSHKGFGY